MVFTFKSGPERCFKSERILPLSAKQPRLVMASQNRSKGIGCPPKLASSAPVAGKGTVPVAKHTTSSAIRADNKKVRVRGVYTRRVPLFFFQNRSQLRRFFRCDSSIEVCGFLSKVAGEECGNATLAFRRQGTIYIANGYCL